MKSILKKMDLPERPKPEPCSDCGDPIEPRLRTNFRTGTKAWALGSCSTCEKRRRAKAGERQRELDRQHRIHELTNGRGIPPIYQDLSLDSFITDPTKPEAKMLKNHTAEHWTAMKKLRVFISRWIDNWKDGAGASLVFSGQPGNGKTLTACIILLGIIQKHLPRDLRMTNVTDLFFSIKSCYGSNDALAETNRMKYLVEIPLLVVDEVGLQSGSNWEFERLSYVIHERINHRKSSIYITNNDGSRWREELGDRITDRFLDGNVFQHIAFAWPSWRSGTIYRKE